jgi:hypothetical protein
MRGNALELAPPQMLHCFMVKCPNLNQPKNGASLRAMYPQGVGKPSPQGLGAATAC